MGQGRRAVNCQSRVASFFSAALTLDQSFFCVSNYLPRYSFDPFGKVYLVKSTLVCQIGESC